jgi:NAD(P)-dependent dehydrogenase (short-subunit alcohol dehydrogenase family)
VVGDILDDKYIQDLVDKAAAFGNGKIHIIVNNAGFTWDGVIHKVGSTFLLTTCQSLFRLWITLAALSFHVLLSAFLPNQVVHVDQEGAALPTVMDTRRSSQ